MGKILKFPSQKVKEMIFVDYEPSKNCCNDDSYGMLCVKCGMCGRKFIDGMLQKGHQ